MKKKKTRRVIAIVVVAVFVLSAIGPIVATFKTATATPTTESTAEETDSADYILPEEDIDEPEDCDPSSYTTVDLPNGAEIRIRIMCP